MSAPGGWKRCFRVLGLRLQPVPDHPLSDWRPSRSAGPWSQSWVCPHCRNDVSHREYMADICETCGNQTTLDNRFRSAATRQVVRDGHWVSQRRIDGVDYLLTAPWTWSACTRTQRPISWGPEA